MVRKIALAVVTAAAVVFASACQGDMPLSPANLEPSFAAASGGVETNEKLEVNVSVFVPCANGGSGESVSMSGTLHTLYNYRSDGKGGFGIKMHSQPQGVTGVGSVTGDKYQGTGVTQSNLNVKAGQTYTFVNNFRMIGQGPGNNYLLHQNVHTTINANGELTATHDNLSVECK